MFRTLFISFVVALLAIASPASADEATCEEWLSFKVKERKILLSGMLSQMLPPELPATTVSCLKSMPAEIAAGATKLCERDGGYFAPTAQAAITRAVAQCEAE
ncbi:MAG: hypothetical protein VX246_12210 [Myxococcota bacterium]|nr:hypothetical protein [Myxococcota bacterium]